MKRRVILVISAICVSGVVSGCIPTIIGAAVYKSSKTRQSKERFIEQFNETNVQRESAGLPPLDLCTEKYSFDKKWADNDPACAARIERYESGDETALGHPKLEIDEEAASEPLKEVEEEGQSPL